MSLADHLKSRAVVIAVACVALAAGSVAGYAGTWLVRSQAEAAQNDQALDEARAEREKAERLATAMRGMADEEIAANRELRRKAARIRHAIRPVGVERESPREAFQARAQHLQRERHRLRYLAEIFVRWLDRVQSVPFDEATFSEDFRFRLHTRERQLTLDVLAQVRENADDTWPDDHDTPQTRPEEEQEDSRNHREREWDDNNNDETDDRRPDFPWDRFTD